MGNESKKELVALMTQTLENRDAGDVKEFIYSISSNNKEKFKALCRLHHDWKKSYALYAKELEELEKIK